MSRGVGMSRGKGNPTQLLTLSGSHHIYGQQVGGIHPTGMLGSANAKIGCACRSSRQYLDMKLMRN